MAQQIEEQAEQVFGECRAIIFILECDNWKELVNGGLSQILLVRQNTRENLKLYRIHGKLESTGQVILNVVLDKDVKYEILQDKSCHHLKTKSNAYLLRLSEDSNGHEFALVVQTIIRSIQDNSPPSPREAWMPPVVRQQQQQHVVLSPPIERTTIIKEQLSNSSDAGRKSPFRPQAQLLGTALCGSTPYLAPSSRPALRDQLSSPRPAVQREPFSSPRPAQSASFVSHRPAQAQRAHPQNAYEEQIEKICQTLSDAVLEGNIQIATETINLLTEQKIPLIIKLKNPKLITVNSGSDSFNIRVVVEDRETSGGTFEMKVSSGTTVKLLQEEVADRYGFPPKVQRWIVGKKMAKSTDTLVSLNIKNTGYTAFLYIVSGINAGLTRGEFERYVNRAEERRNTRSFMSMDMQTPTTHAPLPSVTLGSGTQLSRAASLPSLNTTRQSNEMTSHVVEQRATFRREAQITNASQPTGIPMPTVQPIGIQREENLNQAAGGIPVPTDTGPATQGRLFTAQSISDIERMLASMGNDGLLNQQVNERIGQEESEVLPQGWTCKQCTFVNTPTRPGCEVCGADRPADYIVPQNPRITEQERLRLEKEQEEMEIFQRTLDLQQQEQEVAREMNFLQLVQTAQQNLIRNTEEFDCAICFLTVAPGEGVVLRECLHCFCEDCLREHIKNCTDPEVQCPFQDNDFACHFIITAQEIKALLPEEDFNKFLNRSLVTAESQASNSFHCKTPNCPGWCIYEDNSNVFHCPVCQKVNCLTCKAIHHPEMNCKEYQEDLQRRAQNDVAAKQTQKFLEQMIEKGDAMKCPQCAIILLKKDGCDWMRCSMCRLEICWATRGPRWGPQGVGDLTGGCKCRVGGKKCHPKCKNCH